MQYINDQQQQLELQSTSNKNTVLHVAAQFGNQKYVKVILEKSPSSSLLRCLNIDGETPLHIAVREEHLDIVKALIEYAKRLDHEEVESGGGTAMEMLRAPNKDNDTALQLALQQVWFSFTMPGGYDGNQGPQQGICNGSDGGGIHYRHLHRVITFYSSTRGRIRAMREDNSNLQSPALRSKYHMFKVLDEAKELDHPLFHLLSQ
ncbi:hypothetical protein HYC85_017065 [Camellia sinensis]|uniref:PGG domain-containing protein n=1 Tax=Camellia sinensis TaxID=4442 RepID=A0A7J7H2N1_CAMSI|nr:hypothetical protein HYC85_017065 [Camellia sinensis]